MIEQQSLTGIALLDKLATILTSEERLAFADAVQRGYLVVRPDQRQLQKLWTVWCMKKHWPDVRVEYNDDYSVVTMYLGPCNTTLSWDGTVAIRRAFERYGDRVLHYQTNNWCKHPHVPLGTSELLAANLAQIAYLDGVPCEPEGQAAGRSALDF